MIYCTVQLGCKFTRVFSTVILDQRWEMDDAATSAQKLLQHASVLAKQLSLKAQDSAREILQDQDAKLLDGQTHDQSLFAVLDNPSANTSDITSALKRLLAISMQPGNRTYALGVMDQAFPAIVKLAGSPRAKKSVNLRQLVHLLLLQHARNHPDMALMAVNTFYRELTDVNPVLRMGAVHVLGGGLQVDEIIPLALLSINTAVNDQSPWVRRSVGYSIERLIAIGVERGNDTLNDVVKKLLSDRSPLVLGAALSAFSSLYITEDDEKDGYGQVKFKVDWTAFHPWYRKFCYQLADADSFDACYALEILIRYCRENFVNPSAVDPDETEIFELQGMFHDMWSAARHANHKVQKIDQKNLPGDVLVLSESNNDVETYVIKASGKAQGSAVDADLLLLLEKAKSLLFAQNNGLIVAVSELYYYCAPKTMWTVFIDPLMSIIQDSSCPWASFTESYEPSFSCDHEIVENALNVILCIASIEPVILLNCLFRICYH